MLVLIYLERKKAGQQAKHCRREPFRIMSLRLGWKVPADFSNEELGKRSRQNGQASEFGRTNF